MKKNTMGIHHITSIVGNPQENYDLYSNILGLRFIVHRERFFLHLFIKLKEENKGNIIVLGHIASDAVGINPFVKELRERGLVVTAIKGV